MIIDILVSIFKPVVEWTLSLLPTDFPFLGFSFSAFQSVADTITAFLSPFEQIFPVFMSFMVLGTIISLSLTKAVIMLTLRIMKYFRVLG